jgi:hypothetical protein
MPPIRVNTVVPIPPKNMPKPESVPLMFPFILRKKRTSTETN